MAPHTFLPESSSPSKPEKKPHQKPPSSWNQIKNILNCKQIDSTRVHDPLKNPVTRYTKLGSSCSSICSFNDVVHGNTRVIHRPDYSPESSTVLLSQKTVNRSSTVRSNGANYTFRKLSGCYECHATVDPSRTNICACSKCGEVFPKTESLEHHHAVRHAVSELGPEDSGRNIVEIIFKSSWLKKDNPICKIERILKVHNSPHTIRRFEDCRDTVKARALNSTRKNPRCAADGNELLRFHCTTLTCSLGARGSSSLCASASSCGVCNIIRNGFQGKTGVRTTASSGRAHDSLGCIDGRSAMLVCRVIAGRVRRIAGDAVAEEDGMAAGSYDSVAGSAGIYSNLEELIVFNRRAILPCFVVIYKSN